MCTKEKVLKLTQEQVGIIVDIIHEANPDLDISDASLCLTENGLNVRTAKTLENGELVFRVALRCKKSFFNK